MKIAIVGSGQMGVSTAIALGRYFDITLVARDAKKANSAVRLALKMYRRLSGANDEEGTRITITQDLSAISDAEFVIEAVTEDKNIKIEVIRNVSQYVANSTIITSNTSTLSITELAEASGFPGRFFGCHFFNPAYAISIVELSLGEKSNTEYLPKLHGMLDQAKFSIVTMEEKPGFIVNRALFLMINEAIEMLLEKTATAREIDNLFEKALGHPMGPLTLADFIGLDTCEAILNNLFKEFKQSKYRPSVLLTRKVRAGKLGRKSREGFYHYGNIR